jgi:hypothetical protein
VFDGVGLELRMDLVPMRNQSKHGRDEACQSGKQTQDLKSLGVTTWSVRKPEPELDVLGIAKRFLPLHPRLVERDDVRRSALV